MKTLSSVALIVLIVSALINLSSYFLHFAWSFTICIFLILPLFTIAITVIAQRLKVEFDHLSIILFIYAIATLFITIHLVGDFRVEKEELAYVLKNRATFVREATLEEYRLYKSRSSRLSSAYLLFFFQLFYLTLKSSLSKPKP